MKVTKWHLRAMKIVEKGIFWVRVFSDIPNKLNGHSSVRLIHKIDDVDCKK